MVHRSVSYRNAGALGEAGQEGRLSTLRQIGLCAQVPAYQESGVAPRVPPLNQRDERVGQDGEATSGESIDLGGGAREGSVNDDPGDERGEAVLVLELPPGRDPHRGGG